MSTANREPVEVLYFSDVMCVWAYAGQVRLDEVCGRFGDDIRVEMHFLNIYGDVHGRMREHCGEAADPAAAYAAKMRDVAERFAHTRMHADVFTKVAPASSNQAHLVLCAVRRLDEGKLRLAGLTRRMRVAFFEEARDIAQRDVLFELLEAESVPRAPIERALADGSAMAELSRDFLTKDQLAIAGSPTYVLDGGREKLFGNVGYRIIEANVCELLESGSGVRRGASWC